MPSGKRDFNNTPIAFTFAPGQDTFDIQSEDIVFDDDINEANEGFIIVLNITSGNMDGGTGVAVQLNEFDGILVVIIRDNDSKWQSHTCTYIIGISTIHITFLCKHTGITLGFNVVSYTLSEGDGGTADNIHIVNQSNVLSEIDIPLELTIDMATTAEKGELKHLSVCALYSYVT